MSGLLDANGRPANRPAASSAEILGVLSQHGMKLDALGQQTLHAAILIEFIIEKLNTAAASKDVALLELTIPAYQEFFEARVKEMNEQFQDQLRSAAGVNEAPAVNLDE